MRLTCACIPDNEDDPEEIIEACTLHAGLRASVPELLKYKHALEDIREYIRAYRLGSNSAIDAIENTVEAALGKDDVRQGELFP